MSPRRGLDDSAPKPPPIPVHPMQSPPRRPLTLLSPVTLIVSVPYYRFSIVVVVTLSVSCPSFHSLCHSLCLSVAFLLSHPPLPPQLGSHKDSTFFYWHSCPPCVFTSIFVYLVDFLEFSSVFISRSIFSSCVRRSQRSFNWYSVCISSFVYVSIGFSTIVIFHQPYFYVLHVYFVVFQDFSVGYVLFLYTYEYK